MSFSVPKIQFISNGTYSSCYTRDTSNFNGNNHPFKGMCGDEEFALAHNAA